MKLRITVAIVAMLASVGAASARPVTEEDLLDNYLYDLAFAGLLQNKCPELMINPEIANTLAINNRVNAERDLLPGGKYFKKFAKQLDQYSAMVRGFSEKGACQTAIQAFGPHGHDHPNFMIPKVQE
jgi:hypothetical protein